MPITYTVHQNHIRAIVAKTLSVDISQVQLEDSGDGIEAVITTEDARAPLRTEQMFKRWAKASPAPTTN